MRIGVVGLGYVGMPLAVAFGEAGHDVTGVDTDTRVVEALASGHSHVEDVPDESLRAIAGRLQLTREAPIVVDFRGVTRGIEAPNLVRL
jgi:UDP-N-acetyl-D-glucosamine dehydrogenase